MTGMLKVKVRWAGFTGSPGWSNFFFRDFSGTGEPTSDQAAPAVARVNTFFTAIKDRFTPNVNWTIQPDVEVVQETNGNLVDIFNTTATAPIVGSNTILTYAAPAGVVVTWRTGIVRNGRRVRGRTFLVPTSSACFQADGSIETASLSIFQNAANALCNSTGSPDLGVWARPSAPGANDGSWSLVNSATVPDMAAILRSRRD